MTLIEQMFPGRRIRDLSKTERNAYHSVCWRRWREANPDKARAAVRRYYENQCRNHPEKIAQYRANQHVRRALKAKLFDALLPILQSGDTKALAKMRRQLVKMSESLAT